MTKIRTIAAAAAALAALAVTSQAHAFSLGVKMACASDYYAYCAKHTLDSPKLPGCMRANGLKLTNRCVNALVAGGYVSKSEVERRLASK